MNTPYLDTFEHTFDDKGRVVLPVPFREDFLSGSVVTLKRGYLGVYTEAGWTAYCQRMDAMCQAGEIERDWVNLVYSVSSKVKPDSQGRILVNPTLRAAVGIDSAVRIKGHGDHLGIYVRTTDVIDPAGPSIEDVMAVFSKKGL